MRMNVKQLWAHCPKFSCADAIEVPSTKNGIPVTFPGGEEGNGSTNPNDCDNPWAFGMACQTGNKVGRYQGLNADGTENPDVVFITFCRDGGLGVIGHKAVYRRNLFLFNSR
jgi:hypothetical protein